MVVNVSISALESPELDLVARIPALLLGCGFPNVLDMVDAVYIGSIPTKVPNPPQDLAMFWGRLSALRVAV